MRCTCSRVPSTRVCKSLRYTVGITTICQVWRKSSDDHGWVLSEVEVAPEWGLYARRRNRTKYTLRVPGERLLVYGKPYVAPSVSIDNPCRIACFAACFGIEGHDNRIETRFEALAAMPPIET